MIRDNQIEDFYNTTQYDEVEYAGNERSLSSTYYDLEGYPNYGYQPSQYTNQDLTFAIKRLGEELQGRQFEFGGGGVRKSMS